LYFHVLDALHGFISFHLFTLSCSQCYGPVLKHGPLCTFIRSIVFWNLNTFTIAVGHSASLQLQL